MEKKDYYDVLGVARTASESDIKKAYRKAAREHHPDMVAKEDKDAAEKRFKEINEAYQVLSDSEKKKMYDQFGHTNFNAGGGGGGGAAGGQWGPFSYSYSGNADGRDFDPFDIFEQAFGFRGFGGSRRPRKGKNLYYEFRIEFSEAVKGAEKEVNVESGKVKIVIPKGARDGTEIRFAEKGMPGPEGIPAGDLFISLRVGTPKEFRRGGDNLATAIEIDFVQASLGDTVEIPVVDASSSKGVGKAKLKIPIGTQPGTQIRVKGKGMPRLRSSGNGDVIVQVFVKIPKRLSKKQKQLLEKYKSL